MAILVEKNLNSDLAGVVGNNFLTINKNAVKDAYENNHVVYGSINILADGASMLPLKIYKGNTLMPLDFKLPGGFNIHQPHPELSLSALLYEAYVYYWYRGEFMIYIDEENPLTLEPVNPQLMKIDKIDKLGNTLSWKWDNKLSISKDQLIYCRRMSPDNKRGLAPSTVLEKDLLIYDSAREFNEKFFQNFGKIGGILTDDNGEISPKQMDILVDQFNEEHAGPAKAGKTLGLPSGIKYNELIQTMRDLEFLQGNKDLRDRILSGYSLHKSVFGCTDQVDRSLALTAEKQLWTKTLLPASKRIKDAFNQAFFKKRFPNYRCEFSYDEISVLQEDKNEVLKRAESLHRLGYTTNEINAHLDLGLDDIDEIGDTRFVPGNLKPASDLEVIEVREAAGITDPDKSIDQAVKIIETDQKKQLQMKKELNSYFSKQLHKVLKLVSNKHSIMDINKLIVEDSKTLDNVEVDMESITANTMSLIAKSFDEDKQKFSKNIIQIYKFNKSIVKKLLMENINE